MGEALMFRAGNGSGGGYELKTEIITSNTIFKVPKSKDGIFDVLIFGGGGAGGQSHWFNTQYQNNTHYWYYFGGAGGWMNKASLKLNEGDEITVTIGDRGIANNIASGDAESYDYTKTNVGGTTSFGTYLSANGGGAYTTPYNWIGGGASGGSGGGLYIKGSINEWRYSNEKINGCTGYQFGGGACYYNRRFGGGVYCDYAGVANGGPWGGGGACYTISNSINNKKCGIGGANGGNGGIGGAVSRTAENGTNTMSNTDLDANHKGHGAKGSNYSGGGGYGGNAGSNYGGGGGYAAKGGDNYGGGGGYGIGGYGGSGNSNMTGGGGGYGHGGGIDGPAGYGAGGAGCNNQELANGGSGICIIQYYG